MSTNSTCCVTLMVVGVFLASCSESSSKRGGAGGANQAGQSAVSGGGAQLPASTGGGGVSSIGNVSGVSGTGCTGGLEAKNSSGLCVARMVTITANTEYQIDATEVTQGQYRDWLSTQPQLPLQSDPLCGWKWDAENGQPYEPKGPLIGGDHHPVFGVDWCDATYYCSAVGKRLCGKIGGGSLAFDAFADAGASQWYRACSSAGANKYPFGDSFDSSFCDAELLTHQTAEVGSYAQCQSSVIGFTGVYDLVGNVVEWEDACMAPPETDPSGYSTICRVRGGDFASPAKELACDFGDSTYRYFSGYKAMGIRCCSK